MPDEVLVKCENVSKKFCRSLKRSLWYGAQDICSELNPLRGERYIVGTDHFPELRKDEFWAVNDISFELKRGECLGLIGHNGAGKSTLLKILNGLIKPDHGRITMKGRIGAIIELNAGFNPILTGRENVYIYGSILGFSKKEIDHKYDDIVEFAELADFMEMPFRSYSSGMKVRLGFAVASQMEPDVLIIDEVLAVGDVGFRTKCYNTIFDLMKKSAVIFVSHTMTHIDRTCTCAMLMKNGQKKIFSTNTAQAIDAYYCSFQTNQNNIFLFDEILVANLQVNGNNSATHSINYGSSLEISFEFEVPKKYQQLEISISYLSPSMEIIAHSNSHMEDILINNDGCHKGCKVIIDKLILGSGKKYLSMMIRDGNTNKMLCWAHAFAEINVNHKFFIPALTYFNATFMVENV